MFVTLPKSLTVDGFEKEIYTDFRSILLICSAYNDPELSKEEANYVLVNNLFVDDIEDIQNRNEALKQAIWFVDGGKDYSGQPENSPKLFDWEQDFDFIISAVDKNVKTVETVLELPYMHWWTFLQKLSERKETRLDTLIGIREKLAKGQPLENWEKAILRENKEIVILRDKSNEEFEKELWGDVYG
jgi:hypothetical protein